MDRRQFMGVGIAAGVVGWTAPQVRSVLLDGRAGSPAPEPRGSTPSESVEVVTPGEQTAPKPTGKLAYTGAEILDEVAVASALIAIGYTLQKVNHIER